MTRIAPSLLSADFLHLEESCAMLNRSADIYHIDVMDGCLVPNISFGFPVVEAMAKVAEKPLDVHLMIVQPHKYFERWAAVKGVQMISFHYEAYTSDTERIEQLQALRALGVKAGLAFNPNVPIEAVEPLLPHCDFVLCMSVYAGFGGQKFIPESISRIQQLRKAITSRGLDVEIEVDGGVGESNAAVLKEAGAEILVAGSSVFGATDPEKAIENLRR